MIQIHFSATLVKSHWLQIFFMIIILVYYCILAIVSNCSEDAIVHRTFSIL